MACRKNNAPNCKTNLPADTRCKVTYIHDLHYSAISDQWSNSIHWKQKFRTHYRPNPTQPNPTSGSTQHTDNSDSVCFTTVREVMHEPLWCVPEMDMGWVHPWVGLGCVGLDKQRDFSSVGRTITGVRSRLAASKVEATEMVRWGLRAGLLWLLGCVM